MIDVQELFSHGLNCVKDYYSILNIKSDAPVSAIKQSYRRLAMKYHPDHNTGDALSAIVFSEIAEAYSVLSNASSRNKYNAQRYHTATSEYTKPAQPIDDLLIKAKDLKIKLFKTDPFSLNRDALLYFIRQLLPADINSLLYTDKNRQKEFLEIIVWCSRLLSSGNTEKLIQLMMPLFTQHNWMFLQLKEIEKEQIKKERWEKYKIVLALIIAFILCLLIYFITKRSI